MMKILREGKKFKVQSEHSKSRFYEVYPDRPFCNCPQFMYRNIKTKEPCKHLLAVQGHIKKKTPKNEETANQEEDIIAFVKEKGEVDSLELIDKFGEEAVNQLIEQGQLIEEKGKVRQL